MRIQISAPKDSGNGRFNLNFAFPLALLRWRFVWKHLPEGSRQYAVIAPQMMRALRQYKKENGSWNLVEVQTADKETRVLIRV